MAAMIANSAMFSAHKSASAVVTGLGMVTPLGSTAAAFSSALRSGTSALGRDRSLSRWLPLELGTGCDPNKGELPSDGPMLARVGEFGAAAAIETSRRRRMPRLGQLCVVAAQQALGWPAWTEAAGQPVPASPAVSVLEHYSRERIGVVLGTGLGALDTTLEFTVQYLQQGLGAASPALFPYTVMNTAAALVAMELGLLGPNLTVNHRDLSFAEAVATACELLACGRLDAVLAGGCDELGEWLLHAYARLGMLPASGELLPYDRERQGFCPGEGAVLLLIERAESAEKRGARALARISGIGRAGDDRPRIAWQRPGQDAQAGLCGAAKAVAESLAMAELAPADLDFISGAGNGTKLDRLETLALRQALGAAAECIPIASVLGQTGEWMTSAGVRLGAALYALSEQALPGTRCSAPDPEAALPGLCLAPRPAPSPVRHVLLPTFAQGGGNVCLVLSHP